MPDTDPFDLPEGYGGVPRGAGGGDGGGSEGGTGKPGGQSAAGPTPRRPIDEVLFEIASAPVGAWIAPVDPADPLPPPPPRHTSPAMDAPPLPPGDEPARPPRWPWSRRWRWIKRGSLAMAVVLVLIIAWLAVTAPLSKSLQPIVPPQLTLVSADGRPIARHGAIIDKPVDVTKLPPHVAQAFLAIEDRRFYSHWGVDPRGIARAAWSNARTGSKQGGSTITQQLAKITFLDSDRTITRKGREVLIAFWMEAWLTKDQILSRYLSNAYFGDNVYGLRAASLHYFYRRPERLTLTQAAMLAGLVKAPSRYAPTRNLRLAQERERVVLGAMADAGYITPEQLRRTRVAQIDHRTRSALPTGTYFADWAMPQARATVQPGYAETRVVTTLDGRLQDIARRATRQAGLGRAQVALVAMRPNGEVVAMIGGRDYAASPFNRATQARRQPGSTFKLLVYLAAFRSGLTPDSMIDDSPITTGSYRPSNAGGRYRGMITLREAFARSSNVAAVRLYQQLGHERIVETARSLGITSEIPANASVALGSSGMTLIELTAAYAAVAGNYGPVEPHALHQTEAGFFERLVDGRSRQPGNSRAYMLELLRGTIDNGTGGAARLAIPAYGKTGTTQDSRDALFVGFAGDLVVGVWIGNDDNSPLRGASGGGVPARIWRAFMAEAIPGAAPRPRRVEPDPEPVVIFDDLPIDIGTPDVRIDPEKGVAVDARIGGVGITLDRDGVAIGTPNDTRRGEDPPVRDQR